MKCSSHVHLTHCKSGAIDVSPPRPEEARERENSILLQGIAPCRKRPLGCISPRLNLLISCCRLVLEKSLVLLISHRKHSAYLEKWRKCGITPIPRPALRKVLRDAIWLLDYDLRSLSHDSWSLCLVPHVLSQWLK